MLLSVTICVEGDINYSTLPNQTVWKRPKILKPVSRIACPEVPSVLLNLLRTDPTSEALTGDLYEVLMKSDLISSDQRSEWYENWVHPIANISSESLHQMSLPVLVKLLSRANTLTNGDVYRALLSGSNESGVVPNATYFQLNPFCALRSQQLLVTNLENIFRLVHTSWT